MIPIPGYSRYAVTTPFAVHDCKAGHALTLHQRKRGAPYVRLYADNGQRVQRSVVYLAALAYHGLPPAGFVAYQYAEPVSPRTVRWIPKARAQSHNSRRFDLTETEQVRQMYFERGMTQDAIAARFGVSQATISRAINQPVP